MSLPSEKEAIALLKKYSDSKESFDYVLAHVKAVRKLALKIAKKCPDVDIEIVSIGSLLHDIGRFHKLTGKDRIKHGIIGAQILRKEGLHESLARICERHIGVGILACDIEKQQLPLPKKDFVPETKEEKIIAHADNHVFGSVEKSFEDVLDRFVRELGDEHVARAIALKKEIESWISKK